MTQYDQVLASGKVDASFLAQHEKLKAEHELFKARHLSEAAKHAEVKKIVQAIQALQQ